MREQLMAPPLRLFHSQRLLSKSRSSVRPLRPHSKRSCPLRHTPQLPPAALIGRLNQWDMNMKSDDLELMSVDELWALHETIASILSTRIRAEKLKLEKRLDKLGRKLGNATHETAQRRPYPKVHPKFRNPEPPHQTWSGRGLQPRWVSELVAAGKSLDDLCVHEIA